MYHSGKERFHVRHLVFRVVFPYCRCLLAFYQLWPGFRHLEHTLNEIKPKMHFSACNWRENSHNLHITISNQSLFATILKKRKKVRSITHMHGAIYFTDRDAVRNSTVKHTVAPILFQKGTDFTVSITVQ